jgi:hypothetical protein
VGKGLLFETARQSFSTSYKVFLAAHLVRVAYPASKLVVEISFGRELEDVNVTAW